MACYKCLPETGDLKALWRLGKTSKLGLPVANCTIGHVSPHCVQCNLFHHPVRAIDNVSIAMDVCLICRTVASIRTGLTRTLCSAGSINAAGPLVAAGLPT